MIKNVKILFVDDELNEINGFKKIFDHVADWDVQYALTGKEALKIIEKQEIDIILTDLKMPKMDGIMLLENVRNLKPGTIRILHSWYTDKEKTLGASKSAHLFLAKPSNIDLIKSTIERVISLKKIISNKSIENIVTGIGELPSVPELYFELEQETNSQSPSLKKISEIVMKDVPMTAKILQMVNSAFFGLPQPVSNILQAINYLGLEMIKSLVLLVKIFNFHNYKDSKFNLIDFWDHSIQVAKISQEIVLNETLNQKEAEKAFIAGLLHDIGKLVILKIPGYLARMSEMSKKESLTFTEAEYKFFNISHAEIGAFLLGLWGFPEYLVELVAYHHHKPDQKFYSPGNELMLLAVHFANNFANSGLRDSESIEKYKTDNKFDNYLAIAEKVRETYQENIFSLT